MENGRMNPWMSIWTEPRSTIRQIAARGANYGLWLLAAIYGIDSLLSYAQRLSLGYYYNVWALVFLVAILAPIWGYLVFSVWGLALYWVGNLFKGQGTFHQVRSAYAWASVPLIGDLCIWVLSAAVFGASLFAPPAAVETLNSLQLIILFVGLLVRLLLMIWSLVIFFNALSEVQQFSILRAIGNAFLAAILISFAFGVIFTLGGAFVGAMPMAGLWTQGFSFQELMQ